MKKADLKNKVQLHISADKQIIAQEKVCTRILEIGITPPEMDSQTERAPLNLGLVIDRSGSMQGEKIQFVKQAAAHVVDLLGAKDRTSITIYDNNVDTIFPSEFMTDENKTKAKIQIHEVHSGGSTFLSGGWLKGCEEVAKGATESTINRTLLLTDGLANVGIKDAGELASHARELFLRGVATSCFGVGLGYDEHLLESMANSGSGNFHFLETINAIPLEFEREFEELVNISLRDTVVTVQLPSGVKSEVAAGWQSELIKDRLSISLGSLYSGKKVAIYLKLQFEKNLEGSEIAFHFTVRGKGEGNYLCEDKNSYSFTIVPSSEEEAIEKDQSLMERFVLVDMADRTNEALRRERAGDRAGASRFMNNSINEYRKNMSPSMIDKFGYMANEMSTGMNEEARKRHHREEYEHRRGRDVYRDYHLQLINGHLITRIENLTILIDSGVPISLGKLPEWYFLNEVHTLSQEYMGVTLDYLSKMVGEKIDVLLGTDIMKKYHVTIDLVGRRVTFSLQQLLKPDYSIPMTTFLGVPIATIEITGNKYQMFVDTGAKLSYVDHKVASHFSRVGREMDFYPGMGEFETDVFEIPFKVNHLNFTLRCGVLPPLLETTLLVTGKGGIIGSELYQKYLVDLAFPDEAIYIKEYR